MTNLYMFDDVTASLIPADAEYVGYYVDGNYKNLAGVEKQCPKARLVPIAVTSKDKADVLDVETGDAQIADIYYWLHAGQKPKTTRLPVIYTSVSNVNRMMLTMNANNFVHGKDYLIWSAHYTGTAHICGPATCNATKTACDMTQFTNHAMGHSLDESVCLPEAFKALPTPTPVPVPVKPPVPVPAPPKPAPSVTLNIDGTKVVLEAGKSYTLTVSA